MKSQKTYKAHTLEKKRKSFQSRKCKYSILQFRNKRLDSSQVISSDIFSKMSCFLQNIMTQNLSLHIQNMVESYQDLMTSFIIQQLYAEELLCIGSCCFVAQSCLTFCHPMDCMQFARLLCPWGFPGKNTGVVCHFHL